MVTFKVVYFSVIAATLAGLTASAVANETVATDQWGEPAVTVGYADLDLSQLQGRLILYRRLSYAAQKVCPIMDSSNLGALMRGQACQSDAVKRAMRSIGGPMIARLATERGISLD